MAQGQFDAHQRCTPTVAGSLVPAHKARRCRHGLRNTRADRSPERPLTRIKLTHHRHVRGFRGIAPLVVEARNFLPEEIRLMSRAPLFLIGALVASTVRFHLHPRRGRRSPMPALVRPRRSIAPPNLVRPRLRGLVSPLKGCPWLLLASMLGGTPASLPLLSRRLLSPPPPEHALHILHARRVELELLQSEFLASRKLKLIVHHTNSATHFCSAAVPSGIRITFGVSGYASSDRHDPSLTIALIAAMSQTFRSGFVGLSSNTIAVLPGLR